ncbi:Eukaryotic translation initiation factor 2B, subunit 4 delta, 67kDa [Phytophthora boehmeriae]|uniref:Eukaryotic translation initiation factor 2B, subunit 4 delta, 67kDa n=1 Tax=Phytophthora boehmeriae TaxID=109152 RepID=A0A8T1WNH9_9STRA|nr:Eukaryotic translation initiation factor 2B, subunit 4 delta, 67kDa [Phytophthora boehmeriae]
MADSRSPVLEPGADLKDLETMLDDKSQKRRNKSKKDVHDNYEGKLEGWSPATNHKDPPMPPMEKLSLGPAAIEAKEQDKKTPGKGQEAANDKQKLSKAERKKLAAEAFAKAGGVPKREKMTKAERRAQQEASRQKKEGNAKPKKAETAATQSTPTNVRLQYDDAKKMARRSKAAVVVRTQAQKQVEMFSHLPQYERESSLSLNVGFSNKEEVHSAVLALGLKYAEGKISGGNARCIAMITAFQQVIDDYITPPDKQLRRDLDKRLRPLIQYLIDCRPHGIGMGNAIRRLRRVIGSTPPELSEEEAKRRIREEMDDYVQSRILLASRAVAKNAQSKISAGDVILTYARANVVEDLLLETVKTSPEIAATLRVIVVDSRPHYEGRKLVNVLAKAGLQCSYLQINAVSYIMRDVTKVFLGAAAFMSNGVAVARVGTALVAMTAHEANVPVLFCCETYKFSDRVQLDSITHNELGDPDELVSSYCTDKPRSQRRTSGSSSSDGSSGASSGHVLSDWRDLADLKLLNLVYDVTPIDYVSMVVTELGMIPPTSIPAVLREYSRDGLVDGEL